MLRGVVLAVVLLAGCAAPAPPVPFEGGAPQSVPPTATISSSSSPSPEVDRLTATGCGIERWGVKTLTDPAARSINLTPAMSTIAQLAALPAPVRPTTRTAAEQRTYRVTATVTAYKIEADGDIHLAVKDNAGRTMIFEMPNPGCLNPAKTSPALVAAMRHARAAWAGRYAATGTYRAASQQVTATGVLFFDKAHGQRGVAPNAVELHPLLSLSF